MIRIVNIVVFIFFYKVVLAQTNEIDILPRVAPYVSFYGSFTYNEYPHQSIAYSPIGGTGKLYFGGHSDEDTHKAYLYETDMKLIKSNTYELDSAYHINDMMFSDDYKELFVASFDPNKPCHIKVYSSDDFKFLDEIDLTAFFEVGTAIDALCNAHTEKMYIVKSGNRVVFFDYDFNEIRRIKIDETDKHGDPLLSQGIEYYNGYLLQLNAGDYKKIGATKYAYLNVFDADGCKVETFRYPDSKKYMEAEGICCIASGKYLFTHYLGNVIEVRLLDFNRPSHTHTFSDIMDLTIRPDSAVVGQFYFDLNQNKPLWWSGKKWVDALGNESNQ